MTDYTARRFEKERDEARAQLAEAKAENAEYRKLYGCPRCWHDHPRESMCPSFETRTTGQALGRLIDERNAKRAERAEAERDRWHKIADDRSKRIIELMQEREAVIKAAKYADEWFQVKIEKHELDPFETTIRLRKALTKLEEKSDAS